MGDFRMCSVHPHWQKSPPSGSKRGGRGRGWDFLTPKNFSPHYATLKVCMFFIQLALYMNYLLHRKSRTSIKISRLWYKHRKPYQGETAGCLPNCEMHFLLGMNVLRNISEKVSVYLGWYASYFSNLNLITKGKEGLVCKVKAPEDEVSSEGSISVLKMAPSSLLLV